MTVDSPYHSGLWRRSAGCPSQHQQKTAHLTPENKVMIQPQQYFKDSNMILFIYRISPAAFTQNAMLSQPPQPHQTQECVTAGVPVRIFFYISLCIKINTGQSGQKELE